MRYKMNNYKYLDNERNSVRKYPSTDITKNGYGWSEFQKHLEEGGQVDPFQSPAEELISKLDQVDQEVATGYLELLEYNGNKYYPDERAILASFSSLAYLPSDYTKEWKTADRMKDGINSVKVVLDKEGLAGLALTLLARQGAVWDAGEAKKVILKAKKVILKAKKVILKAEYGG